MTCVTKFRFGCSVASLYIYVFISLHLLKINHAFLITKQLSIISTKTMKAHHRQNTNMIIMKQSSCKASDKTNISHPSIQKDNNAILPSSSIGINDNIIPIFPVLNKLFMIMFIGIFLTLNIIQTEPAYAKAYSQNAKNLERLNAGDSSGGSIYDNNLINEGAKKRRALTGCKITSTRQEASMILSMKKNNNLNEKECNTLVLQGETEFMLQAIRNLECPTCPYGINPDRSKAIRN